MSYFLSDLNVRLISESKNGGSGSWILMSPLLYSSDAAVIDFFKKVTGDEGVVVGEGTLIDAYDDGGIGVSLDNADSVEYRRRAFGEGLADLGMKNMPVVASKVVEFLNSLAGARKADTLG